MKNKNLVHPGKVRVTSDRDHLKNCYFKVIFDLKKNFNKKYIIISIKIIVEIGVNQ